AWSPDGAMLAVLASSHSNPAEGWDAAQLHVVNVSSGEMWQIAATDSQLGGLTWSPDGPSIAVFSGVLGDEGDVAGESYVLRSAGGEARCITPGVDHSITWIEWREQGIFYGGRHIESAVLGCIDPVGGSIRLLSKGLYAINSTGGQQLEQISIARNN